MNIEYCIVQAGGKGTRLKHLTRNKPKCLVSIQNKPIVFTELPEAGSFTRWLAGSDIKMQPLHIKCREIGTISSFNTEKKEGKYRPYNKIVFEKNKVIKTAILPEGEPLLVREKKWYQWVEKHSYLKALDTLHGLEKDEPGNIWDIQDTYFFKTMKILNQTCSVIPFANDSINVWGNFAKFVKGRS